MEALHDSYVAALSGRARFEGRSRLKTWFFGVVRNMARSARRRAGLRAVLFAPAETGQDVATPSTQEAAADASRIETALQSLPRRQAEIAWLVFFHDFTVAEAAEALGVSAGTAAQHYARAKARLAQAFGEETQS